MPIRVPLFVALFAALGPVLFGLGSSACSSQTCNVDDCGRGLTLSFDKTVPRDYTLTVTIDGKSATADCSASVDADTTAEVTVTLDDLELDMTCGPEGLTFATSPDKVTVVLAFPDGVTTTVNADPAYEDYPPEGGDCDEPICRRATYDMVINPPT